MDLYNKLQGTLDGKNNVGHFSVMGSRDHQWNDMELCRYLSDRAKDINQQVKDWETAGQDYIKGDSPFASGAKEVYNPDELKDPTQETTETDTSKTNENGEPRDNQEEAQNFMNSYKDSLKAVLFNPENNKQYGKDQEYN